MLFRRWMDEIFANPELGRPLQVRIVPAHLHLSVILGVVLNVDDLYADQFDAATRHRDFDAVAYYER